MHKKGNEIKGSLLKRKCIKCRKKKKKDKSEANNKDKNKQQTDEAHPHTVAIFVNFCVLHESFTYKSLLRAA